ncbi:site-specific integrase [Pseudobacillus badius]|uniref:site-specific integrase n=1 Tax=Bacillus badius TaxID=1455 RepID=UPI0007B4EBC7|nr:site-specific integrase [Bacillus badius]KZO01257.1 hypothetical protein A4244_13415 [Bacillus badius]TDW02174.1 site-specific recombinase XerD [Bacillus badius]
MDFDKLIKEKAKGFYFRIDVGKNPINGKRTQKSFGPYRTKTEAKKQLVSIRAEVLAGKYFISSQKSFEPFINEWFDVIYRQDKKETTLETRRYTIDSQLIPYFGQTLIDEIDSKQIDKFFIYLRSSGRKSKKANNSKPEKKEELSGSYLNIIYDLLKQVFATAVSWSLIEKNPLDGKKRPKIENNKNKKNKSWTKDELNLFLEAASKKNLTAPFLVDVMTGLRRGELSGLKWTDINFDEKTITVNGSLYRKKGEGIKYKDNTKTESSDNRVITVPDIVIDVLQKEKVTQMEMKKKSDENFNKDNYVFVKIDGKPFSPDYLTKKFREIIRSIDVKQITLHGLRHTNASLLMKLGTHAKVVSDILGHSRIQVTLDFYSHSDQELIRKSTDELEKYVFSS